MQSSRTTRTLLKSFVFLLCCIPISFLLYQAFNDELSANPIGDITNATGIWTLRFLVIGLSLTPLRLLTGWTLPAQLRRMIGLFAFFYVCLHFTTYVWLDKFFDTEEMIRDVAKRKYIMAGFSTFLMLIPLAVTSTDGMMRRLGGKKWKRIHRLVYVASVGGVVHYLWLVKADIQRPMIYGGIVLLLLGFRFVKWTQGRGARKGDARRENAALSENAVS